MTTPMSSSTRSVGLCSAVLATVFSLMYVVAQLAEWSGLLGSRGGPESTSTPLGIVVLLTPSLLLGSSFLVLVVSIHQLTAPERRVWSHAAVAFATAYATLISIVYFVQLTLVAPRLGRGDAHDERDQHHGVVRGQGRSARMTRAPVGVESDRAPVS